MISGPSSFSAPSSRAASEKVRWLREPVSIGSYIEAMSLVSGRGGRLGGAVGLLHRRRNFGRGRVTEEELVEHAACDRRRRGAVLAVLDQHRHGDLRVVGRCEGDEPA